ncbi:hypothetical protein MASR2M79_24090 [Aminivibrio sp.]
MLFMVVLVARRTDGRAISPIYLLAREEEPSIGLLNGLDNLLSALYSFPGGYIADRFGTGQFLALQPGPWRGLPCDLHPRTRAVPPGLFSLLDGHLLPGASMKLIARVLLRTSGPWGSPSTVRRIPMALGPLFGGLMIGFFGERAGVRPAFAGASFWPSWPFCSSSASSARRTTNLCPVRRKSCRSFGSASPDSAKSPRLGHPHPLREQILMPSWWFGP